VSATEPALAFDARTELGESPVWDERTGTLLFVDIVRGVIARCDPKRGETETVAVFEEPVGSIALRRDGGLVAAVGTAIVLLDEQSNRTIVARLPDAGGLRFNDGACDPQGRYWIGTMALDLAPGRGTLCRYDARGLVPMVAPVSISNGIDWSADATRMYYVDTPSRRVDVFAFDAQDGSLSDRRTLVEIEQRRGSPTGWPSTRKTTCGSHSGTGGGFAATGPTACSTALSSFRCRDRRAARSAGTISRTSTSPPHASISLRQRSSPSRMRAACSCCNPGSADVRRTASPADGSLRS